MSILTDYHLHSSFSGDSETPMEDMIQKAISIGLKTICFTEHMDMDYPLPTSDSSVSFEVNTDSYLYDLLKYKEKYSNIIQLYFGIELGLQPHIAKQNEAYAKSYDFDFILGSSHISNKRDPYYSSFFEGRSEESAYREYFLSIIDNIKNYSYFDVYGHLDYVIRYGPNTNKNYSYQKYADLFDEILKLLIQSGKGIEVNTAGLKYGLGQVHPSSDVIKRYKELGGDIITIGSDGHKTEHIAYKFSEVPDLLKSCGFHYYTIFKKRTPEFIKI
ncbi:MAG TPA: histidinol-phosphatase HisJ family protein [Lachnospiraceae bacterium]|nr:histidinol-phosphatase HisJ family protein [Lachnospiraceae bacterium]